MLMNTVVLLAKTLRKGNQVHHKVPEAPLSDLQVPNLRPYVLGIRQNGFGRC